MYAKRNYPVARSILLLSLANIVALVGGAVREITIAFFFGTTAAADAFSLAIFYIENVGTVVVTGLASFILVPIIVRHDANGDEYAGFAITDSLLWLVFALAVPSVLISVARPFWLAELIAPEFSRTQLNELASLLRLCVPSTFVIVAAAVTSGILQARGDYYSPVYGRALFGLCVAAVTLGGAQRFGIQAAAMGVVLGAVMQFCVQIVALVRLGWRPGWPRRELQFLREIIAVGLPILLALILTNVVTGGAQRAIASSLPEGSLAAVNYAHRILNLVSVVTMSLATVSLTELSKTFQREGLGDKTVDCMRNTLKSGLFILTPFSVFLALLSEPIVAVLFHRGQYTVDSLRLTVECFRWFVASAVPGFVLAIFTRAFPAFSMPWKVTVVALVLSISTIISTAMSLAPLGAKAIPASYTIGSFIACCGGCLIVKRIVKGRFFVDLGNQVLRTVFVSAGPLVLVSVLVGFLHPGDLSGWTITSGLRCLAAAMVVFSVSFIVVCVIMKEPHLDSLWHASRRFFGRRVSDVES